MGVDVLGLERTLILLVGDAVPVVVEIRAAVLVLEAVVVLGFERAAVALVGDAVEIVVGLGAAVGVDEDRLGQR